MTHDPRTKDDIYQSLRESLTGKIAKLTNFTDRSFNFVWTQAFSEEVRELEVLAVVSELAGWVDYTGGPVTEDDLETLGISDSVSADEVNEFMENDYLDEFVKIVGISRLPGQRATGEVDFQTQSQQTDIPEGTRVTTRPDAAGETIDFVTTEAASTSDGVTTVTGVQIQAVDVGEQFNVSSNTIVRLAEPPLNVTGVDNPASTTGGTDRESNEDLRTRAKQAVQSSSEGGTVDGIKGYIRQNVEGVGAGDIIVDEFTSPCPPYVDVIVDGGIETDVLDAIDFSRPAGIEHNLVRPEIIEVGIDASLLGTDINTSGVEDDINTFLLDLGISENLYRDEIVRQIMESDDDIINIGRLGGTIERVTNETFTFSTGTTDYLLDFTYESTNGSITVEDESGDTFTEGSDFEVQDQTGDGYPETLVWIGSTPDDTEQFFVDYDVTIAGTTAEDDEHKLDLIRDEFFTFEEGRIEDFTFDQAIDLYELTYVPFDGSSSISDNSGDSYEEGTDYEIIDDSGNGFAQTVDWSDIDLGGAVADDGGTTTDETTEANDDTADDMTLLPSSPATGDAYYFGFSQTYDDIRIDISTAGAGTWDIVWEYYDGASWVSLSNVTDGTNDFRNSGVNEVSWDVPIDWSTTSVGGISGLYWVRGRLDTFSSISTQPLGTRADQDGDPDDNESFTINYNQKLYETDYEIVETPAGEISDASGDTYTEGTEFEIVDYTEDQEDDAIHWLTNPGSLDADEEFYFTYFNEGDRIIDPREKVDPGTISVTTE